MFRGRTGKGRVPDLTGIDKRLVMRVSGRRLPSWRQLKHLPRYLRPKERAVIAVLTAVTAVGIGAMAVRFVSDRTETIPKDGGNYTEAAVGNPRYVNPVLAATNDADNDLIALVFSGLMRFDAAGRLTDDLAESHEITDDGKTYTFTLKPLVEWHDGTAMTANDVVATFNYIRNPAWKSPWQSRFRNMTVEAPDDRTVRFTLQEPSAPFLSMLTVGILPAHLWEEVMPENAERTELNIRPVGTGPFRLKGLVKDRRGTIKSVTLVRNDRYYGQKPHLETVTFRYYADFNLAVESLLNKKSDGLGFVPAESREALDRLRSIREYALRLPQYTAIFLNQSKSPILRSREIRQALNLAVNRTAILRDALDGRGVAVHGPILPRFPGFRPGAKSYGLDPEAAAKLLDQAGYVLDEEGRRGKETKVGDQVTRQPLKVTLTVANTRENLAVAQMVKADWEQLGIEVELDTVDANRIQKDRIRPREYEALIYGEIIGPDVDPYPFWHSSQKAAPGLNLSAYSHRRSDELLELGRTTTDEGQREAYYSEFQELLTGEAPAVFLYNPTYSYMINSRIRGITPAAIMSPSDRFAGIADWHVKTKRVWR